MFESMSAAFGKGKLVLLYGYGLVILDSICRRIEGNEYVLGAGHGSHFTLRAHSLHSFCRIILSIDL